MQRDLDQDGAESQDTHTRRSILAKSSALGIGIACSPAVSKTVSASVPRTFVNVGLVYEANEDINRFTLGKSDYPPTHMRENDIISIRGKNSSTTLNDLSDAGEIISVMDLNTPPVSGSPFAKMSHPPVSLRDDLLPNVHLPTQEVFEGPHIDLRTTQTGVIMGTNEKDIEIQFGDNKTIELGEKQFTVRQRNKVEDASIDQTGPEWTWGKPYEVDTINVPLSAKIVINTHQNTNIEFDHASGQGGS